MLATPLAALDAAALLAHVHVRELVVLDLDLGSATSLPRAYASAQLVIAATIAWLAAGLAGARSRATSPAVETEPRMACARLALCGLGLALLALDLSTSVRASVGEAALSLPGLESLRRAAHPDAAAIAALVVMLPVLFVLHAGLVRVALVELASSRAMLAVGVSGAALLALGSVTGAVAHPLAAGGLDPVVVEHGTRLVGTTLLLVALLARSVARLEVGHAVRADRYAVARAARVVGLGGTVGGAALASFLAAATTHVALHGDPGLDRTAWSVRVDGDASVGAQVVDGDPTTGWTGASAVSAGSVLEVDLGAVYAVSRVVLHHGGALGGAPRSLSVSGLSVGEAWAPAELVSEPTASPLAPERAWHLEVPLVAHRLRIQRAPGDPLGPWAVREVRVWGTRLAAAPPEGSGAHAVAEAPADGAAAPAAAPAAVPRQRRNRPARVPAPAPRSPALAEAGSAASPAATRSTPPARIAARGAP